MITPLHHPRTARRPVRVAALAALVLAGAGAVATGTSPAMAAGAPAPAVPATSAGPAALPPGAPALTDAGPAVAPAACATTPSTVVPGILITDPRCGFTSQSGSATYAGVLDGAAYRIEVPQHWNGSLVMFAHGFAGNGNVVTVGDPQLRSWYVQHGYAWAASSYRQNGYDVGYGVTDTHALKQAFSRLTGRRTPSSTYMTGLSMGGAITAVTIEAYPGEYVGAMPYCGVLGGNALFDYFLGANVTAAAITGTTIQYPTSAAAGVAYTPAYDAAVKTELPALGVTASSPTSFTTGFTPKGLEWAAAVQQLSGGTRPGFREAVKYYWNTFGFAPLTDVPFLFGVYPGLNGGTLGFADGSVAGNTGHTYQLDQAAVLTPQEKALNAAVLRVPKTANPGNDPAATQLPDVAGDPRIPVVSLHDIDDLFVPFSMEQVYAQRVAAHGESDLFVSRAIRGTGHCEFTTNELSSAFSGLVSWVTQGAKPAGDPVTDEKAVRNGTFGCRFTDPTKGAHLFFGRVPCSS